MEVVWVVVEEYVVVLFFVVVGVWVEWVWDVGLIFGVEFFFGM